MPFNNNYHCINHFRETLSFTKDSEDPAFNQGDYTKCQLELYIYHINIIDNDRDFCFVL